MAQGFKLVLRPSKPGEKDSEKKFYAVSKTNGTSSMKTLCKYGVVGRCEGGIG